MGLSLSFSSLQAFETHLTNGVKALLEQETASFVDITEQIERVYLHIQEFPTCLHNDIARRCLNAGEKLSSPQFSSLPLQEFAVKKLVSISMRLRQKILITPFGREPDHKHRLFHVAILESLREMRELEVFKCSLLGKHIGRMNQLILSVPNFVNLTSFSCFKDASDDLVKAICDSCHLIQYMDLTSSEKVTNDSISSLSTCKNLRQVFLSSTGVTERGCADLLINSQSTNLVELWFDRDKNELLRLLEKDVVPPRAFRLQEFFYHTANITKLHLVNVFFPNLSTVTIKNRDFDELTPHLLALGGQENITKAKLTVDIYSAIPCDAFSSLSSSVLTHLELYYLPENPLSVKISTVINIGLQCPNIRSLLFSSISLLDDTESPEFYPSAMAFSKLQKFTFHSSRGQCSTRHILRYAFAVRDILIVGDAGDLRDDFFEYVWDTNPLAQLASLSIPADYVSTHVLKRIITECKKLNFLGRFFNAESEEIETFIFKKGLKIELGYDIQ